MSDNSGIEWTDATWNPVTGCTKVSPGCDHCYAETFAERFRGVPGHHFEQGFDVVCRPERLDIPLRWTKPRRIFVNSMSDLFHVAVSREHIAKVFAVMAVARRHTFQVLTKRHARMRSLLSDPDFMREVAEEASDLIGQRGPGMWPALEVSGVDDGWHVIGQDDDGANVWAPTWPLPNVWLGVSVETQQWADIRVPALLHTPAAVRFLSCEPLLGPVDLFGPWGEPVECADLGPAITHEGHSYRTDYGTGVEYDCEHQAGVDWVIVGGESGQGARPMHPDWARSLREQCVAADVPFLFKQAGSALAREWGCKGKGTDPAEWPESFPREYPCPTR